MPKDRSDSGPIEVITSIQRRRRFSPEEKRALVEEAEQPGNSISLVARKYGINLNQLFRWRKLVREGALSAVGADENVVPASEVKQLKQCIRELERLLGKKTMEAEILREAIEIAREKNCSCGCPGPRRTIPSEDPERDPLHLPFGPLPQARWEPAHEGSLPERRR
jgi:transposase